MTDTRPAPLVPADVDLRGLEYMPFFGNHLFGSEFNARATDSEWRAGLTLWWAAWNQVPAGSLPADDTALCRLADLGRDLKTWRRLKEAAMHGFVLCSDRRMYHEFLCKQVLVAWDKRVKERERKAAWRKNKGGDQPGRDADVPRDKPPSGQGPERGQDKGPIPGRDADVPADGNRRDGTGRDGTMLNTPRTESELLPPPFARALSGAEPEDRAPPPRQEPTRAAALCLAMRRQAGFAATNPGDPRFIALVEQGITEAECVGLAAECVAKGKGWGWFLDVLPKRRAEAAAISLPAQAQPAARRELTAEELAALERDEAERLADERRRSSPEGRARAMEAKRLALAAVTRVTT